MKLVTKIIFSSVVIILILAIILTLWSTTFISYDASKMCSPIAKVEDVSDDGNITYKEHLNCDELITNINHSSPTFDSSIIAENISYDAPEKVENGTSFTATIKVNPILTYVNGIKINNKTSSYELIVPQQMISDYSQINQGDLEELLNLHNVKNISNIYWYYNDNPDDNIVNQLAIQYENNGYLYILYLTNIGLDEEENITIESVHDQQYPTQNQIDNAVKTMEKKGFVKIQ